MSQWKNDDSAANSVLWAVVQYNKPANTTTQANFYNNVTSGAFVSGVTVGQFGVDTTEMGISAGNLAFAYVTSGGSGYSANAVVTLTFANGTTNATAVNAFANVTAGVGGAITSLLINQPGSTYTVAPAVTIAAPSAINITANSTGFSNTNNVLLMSTANSKFQAGDRLYYGVPAANTPIAPLTGNTYYYVSFANTTAIALSDTSGGANIDITDARTTNPGETHTVTGDTATGYVVVGGAKNTGVAHAGWVVRTEGTGGRAGRVSYETLVAMGSMTSDGSEDTILPP
jgi:hypothetical protein